MKKSELKAITLDDAQLILDTINGVLRRLGYDRATLVETVYDSNSLTEIAIKFINHVESGD